jgi:hypothetical protein
MTKITATIASSKSYTHEVYEENKDLIEFGKRIDFTPLFQAVSKKLGLVNTLEFTKPSIHYMRGDFYVDCSSGNIADRVGVLASVLNNVYLFIVSSRIKWDEENNRYFLWAIINFRYHHVSGGSNGLEFVTAWFNNEEGWTFKFVEPHNRD